MSKIEEIEKEVQGLKPNELQAFRKWFWDFDAEGRGTVSLRKML